MIYKIILLLKLIFLLAVNAFAQSPKIEVISPNGGEILIPGMRYSISWVAKEVELVSIHFRTDVGSDWELIYSNISADIGSYSWKIPDLSSNKLEIKISSESIFDISDHFTSIESHLQKYGTFSSTNVVDTIRIMPLGNSITFDNRQNDVRPVEDKIGYRYPLYNMLKDSGYTFIFVGSEHAGGNFFSPEVEYDKNAGFPGIKDNELYTLLNTGRRYQPQYGIDDTLTDGRYLDAFPADIILLHIGTNGNDQPGGTNAGDVENILDEIDEYETSTSSEIVVFLARIINRVPNEGFVTDFNENIINMAMDRINNPLNDAYPDKIKIVDMENISGFNYSMSPDPNGSPGDMNDQLHPNDKGYSKIAQTWFNSLDSVFNSPPSINVQPLSQSVIEGDTLQFIVSASGPFRNTFQWKINGSVIIGENDSVLILKDVSLDYNQSIFTCQVSSIGGFLESEEAFLNVTARDSRVSSNLMLFYSYDEEDGVTIFDNIQKITPIDLAIQTPNSINWLSHGLTVSNSASISYSGIPTNLYHAFQNSDEITIELLIKPLSVSQNGPARIITYSFNGLERNFGVFQNSDRYDLRIRTTLTNNNGVPSIITNAGIVKLEPTHIVYTLSSNDTAKLFINGILQNKMYLAGTFENWDSTYSFGIANEFIDSKPWLGTYYLTAIYTRALSALEIEHNYSISINQFENLIPPGDLTANIYIEGKVELNWIDKSDYETGFYILRKSIEQESFEYIDSVSANIVSYTDELVVEGINYNYAITAYNDLNESEISNVISIVTQIPKPTELEGLVNNLGMVELSWKDNSENELGFIIEGKPSIQDSSFRIIDTVGNNATSYIDTSAKYFSPFNYRIYAYTKDTVSTFSNEISIIVVGILKNDDLIIKNFNLYQNYPNPFNPLTNIRYYLPEQSSVSLIIYNALGESISKLVNTVQEKGDYKTLFNASKFSSGVYFYRLKARSIKSGKEFDDFKKLLLLK